MTSPSDSARSDDAGRRLVVMRHATAASGGRDHERPLTAEGRDEAHRVGERLRAEGPVPDRILCSSARRCRETCESLLAGLGSGPAEGIAVEVEDALYDASPDRLLHAVAGVDSAEVLLVIAHNPGVSLLAIELASGRAEDRARIGGGFSPATTACFRILRGDWSTVSPQTARLVRVDRPRAD